MLTNQTLILFDDADRDLLLPLTFTRPVADLRLGIMTIREKWEHALQQSATTWTADYLSGCFPCEPGNSSLLINGSVLPDDHLVQAVQNLQDGQALVQGDLAIAVASGSFSKKDSLDHLMAKSQKEEYSEALLSIRHPWDIFLNNGEALQRDFAVLTAGKSSGELSATNTVIGEHPVFLAEGAKAECATFNTSKGPVYIGPEAEVMENSVIRGPFAMADHAVVKVGAKIYGPTTLGPHVKAGGEVNNSVITGYSNKAHDGFLGNSVIGEWCNIGADTNNSNLRNDYGNVKMWSYRKESFEDTGQQFVGLVMGDHSKCGINTMFNTGTVVGVSANIYGGGFPRQFIPSFSWGGSHGFSTYRFDKACMVAERMMGRRGLKLSEHERQVLAHIFEVTEQHRHS